MRIVAAAISILSSVSIVSIVSIVAVFGCSGAPRPRASPPGDAAPPTPDAPAAPAVTLTAADCRALREATALGVAVVTTSEADCSGIGHLRSVLEVRRLVRGDGITRIAASKPLGSTSFPDLAAGDTVIVSIEPDVRPAETVACVALPARQGTARHAVKVASLEAAGAVLETLASSVPCPAP